jgi:hypothetical protein
MRKKIKWIVIGIFLLICLVLFIWGDKLNIPAGSIFAGLALLIAAIKSRLFGSDKLLKEIDRIQNNHEIKRKEWEQEKQIQEQQYDSLKNILVELDARIEQLDEELGKTEYRESGRSEEEVLRWMREN